MGDLTVTHGDQTEDVPTTPYAAHFRTHSHERGSDDIAWKLRLRRALDPPFASLGSGGVVVLVFDVADRAANLTTSFGRHIHLADLTTDEPSLLGLCNGYSLFTQHFEDCW